MPHRVADTVLRRCSVTWEHSVSSSLPFSLSSPLPTLGGPDILTAILAAGHRNPWYEYAVVATAGSVIGAYLTFRVARKAGSAYLERTFQHKALSAMFGLFQTW